MARPTEFIVSLTIVGASQLPKTERFSKIDPYIQMVYTPGAGGGVAQTFRTRAIDDCEEPRKVELQFICRGVVLSAYSQYDETFYPRVGAAPGAFLSGTLSFNLFDENVVSDAMIGSAKVVLDGKSAADLAHMTLMFEFTDAKFKEQGRQSSVAVAFHGAVQSFNSMVGMWSSVPGVIVDQTEQAIYMPVPECPALMVGVEYEKGGSQIDVKVLVVDLHAPQFADLMLMSPQGNKMTKVYRKVNRGGRPIAPGARVPTLKYEELKLDDLPVGLDYNWASLLVFDVAPLETTNTDTIVTAHGWAGAMNFAQAARKLHSVEIDHQHEEIYMTVMPHETTLMVDYDKDDADIKLAVSAGPTTEGKVYDLSIPSSRNEYAKRSQVFFPPKAKLGGRLPVARLIELDDLPYGTAFSDIIITKYHIANTRQFTIQGLTRIMG